MSAKNDGIKVLSAHEMTDANFSNGGKEAFEEMIGDYSRAMLKSSMGFADGDKSKSGREITHTHVKKAAKELDYLGVKKARVIHPFWLLILSLAKVAFGLTAGIFSASIEGEKYWFILSVVALSVLVAFDVYINFFMKDE